MKVFISGAVESPWQNKTYSFQELFFTLIFFLNINDVGSQTIKSINEQPNSNIVLAIVRYFV